MLFGPVWYLVFQESDFKSYASFTESQSMVKNQKKKKERKSGLWEEEEEEEKQTRLKICHREWEWDSHYKPEQFERCCVYTVSTSGT